MAQAFNLTAQINIQANQGNINQTVNRIKKQLEPLGTVNLKVNTNAQALAKASKNVQGLSKGLQQSQKNASNLNKTLAESARRFSVITVATGTLLSFVNAFKKSVRSAIEFETELIKISQVTGRTTGQLKGLTDEVTRLSTSLGVSSADLLNTSRILLQTGLSADKATKALEILAKTTLAATFDDIQSTTEGAIAILNQFGGQAAATGNDIKFLEQSLDAINAVSKNFAVESGDLVSAIRRVGGVFSNAGGSVEELVALFTSVRATTRESAETIATGLRTIFTRIQRAETVDQLKQLGIQLQDAQGNFVGAFEAVKRLSEGLSGLDPRSFRFSQIVEELGGFRQIGKVIPLINQFTVAQNALNVAQNASGSTSKDAQTAQKGLGIEIAKTREEFNQLVRSFTGSEAFRSVTVFLLKLAQSFIKVAEALEPLLPLLGTLFALKVGQGLAGGLGLLRGFAGGSSGIQASRFNSGGMVPGSGNRDTVPAMLTPGEFVIRKKSVEKLGANNLAQMNAGRGVDRKKFALGGQASKISAARQFVFQSDQTKDKDENKVFDKSRTRFNPDDNFILQRAGDKKIDVNQYKATTPGIKKYRAAVKKGDPRARGLAFEQVVTEVNPNITLAPETSARIDALGGTGQLYEIKSEKEALTDSKLNKKVIGGTLSPISELTDRKFADRLTATRLTGEPNDINLGKIGVIQDVTDNSLIGKEGEGIQDKLGAGIKKGARALQQRALGGLIQKFAAGGSVLNTTQVGAAILDPDIPAKASEDLGNIGAKDVQASVALRGNKFSGRVGEFIKSINTTTSRKFTLKRQGLDERTSGKFSEGILDGVVDGISTASNRLGADLGLGNIPISEDSIAGVRRFFGKEGSVVGQLFEAAVNNVSNLGKFSEGDLGAPFDFAGGITGPLADNYKRLPAGFVDAKKSFGVATKANFRGKIANQIGREFIASKFNAPKKANKGGPAGSDTVPALLTPGEFVFNKKAADSIGRANLDKMNKQGVAGFAKGGSVGFKRFAKGGPTGSGLGLNNVNVGSINEVTQALNSIGVSAGKTAESTARYNKSLSLAAQALLGGASSAEAFDIAFKNLKKSSDQAKQSVEATAKAQAAARANPTAGDTVAGDERLASAQGLGGGSPTRSFGQAAAGDKKDPYLREALADQQKKEIAAIAREIRATDQNVTAKDAITRAENVVRNEYGVLGKELIKASKETKKTQKEQSNFAKVLQTAAAAVKKQGLGGAIASGAKAAPGAAKEFAGGAGQTFQKAGKATQSLQTFAFAGAALSDLATSSSGLSKAQEEATQQVVATATTFLFLGSTILDLLGNLAAFGTSAKVAAGANLEAAATEGVESKTNVVNAVTEGLETKSNVAAKFSEDLETKSNLTSAGSGLAGALIGVTAVVAGLYLAFQFLISEAEATAEAEAKKTKATLDSIRSGEGGSAEQLRASVGGEVEALDTAKTRRGQRNLAIGGALAGAAATAAFGAAVGSAVPVVGTLIGAVVGAGVGLAIYAATSEDAAAKQESLNNALDSTINTLVAVNQANAEFQQKIQDINNLPLDAADKVNALLSAQASKGDGGLTTLEQNSQGVASALATLQSQLSATGDLTVNDLANLDEEGLKKLGEDEGLDPRVIKQIQFAGATLNDSFKGLAAQTKQTRDTLGQAAQLEITGEVPFQELIQGSGAFARALRAAEEAARAEAQAKANRLKAEAKSLQDQDPTGNADRVNELNKQAADEINRVNQTLAQQRAAYAKQNASLAENRARLQEEAKARLDQINLLKQQNAQLAAINNLTRGFENAKAATDDFVANLNGQVSQIEIRDTDLGANLPIGQLESNLTQFLTTIQSLPPQFQAAGQEAAFALRDSRKFIEGATGTLVGQPEITQGKTADQIISEVLKVDDDFLKKQLGGSEAALEQFKKQLQEAAASGGVITPEEAKKLFAPVREANEGYANQIKSLTDASRAQANALRAQTAKEIAIRDKNRESIENYNSVVSQNAEALASARGQSTAGVRRRLERENRQRLLDAGAGARGGIKLQAGNVKQLKLARQQAKAAQEVILKQKALARQNGASAKTIAQLEKRQSQLAETVKDADAALQEFASSTAVIDELTEALEKEKQVREQAFAVLKEFVAGGKDVRKTLQSGASGILSALRTGTTQNQTEEQRADTFALLDKLKDVQIGTTGLTGEQVSQEIVFRDAVRLGFPPDIAKQLATQTTTEEQILKELQKQTQIAQFGPLPLNKGGPVPGAGNTDTVPAMLTPGEFVLNKAAASRIGTSNLNAMNSGKARYLATGSNVPEYYLTYSKEARLSDELNEKYGYERPSAGIYNQLRAIGIDFDLFDALSETARRVVIDGAPEALKMLKSNLLEKAIAAGYRPSLKGTSQQTTDDPILNPTLKPKNADEALSERVSGPKEFLDTKAQQKKRSASEEKRYLKYADAYELIASDKIIRDPDLKPAAIDGSRNLLQLKNLETYEQLNDAIIKELVNKPEFAGEEINKKKLYGALAKKYGGDNDAYIQFGSGATRWRPWFNDGLIQKALKFRLEKYKENEQREKTKLRPDKEAEAKKEAQAKVGGTKLPPKAKKSIDDDYYDTSFPYDTWTSVATDKDGNPYSFVGRYYGLSEDQKKVRLRSDTGKIIEVDINKLSGESRALGSKYYKEEKRRKNYNPTEALSQDLQVINENYSSYARARNATAQLLFNAVQQAQISQDPNSTFDDKAAANIRSYNSQALAESLNKFSPQKWTDKTGQYSTLAKFGGITNGTVTLYKLDNTAVNVPLSSLSASSQRLAKAEDEVFKRSLQPEGLASGGPVQYRAGGGTIFKPRGTDTVPAMLTPGEFVIKKSSVDKIGAGNLAALNNGNAAVVKSQGGPIYRSGGGQVNYLAGGGIGAVAGGLGPGGFGAGAGGQINFGNALTLQGGVNALSGNAAKALWRQIVVSAGQPKVAKLVRNEVGLAEVKDLNRLIKTGQFDPSRFLGANLNSLARIFDVMNQLNPTVFTTLDAGNATVSESVTANGLQRWIDNLKSNAGNYQNAGTPESRKIFQALTKDTPLEKTIAGYRTLLNRLMALRTQIQNQAAPVGLDQNRSSITQIKAAGGVGLNTGVIVGGGVPGAAAGAAGGPGGPAAPGFVGGGAGGGAGGGPGATLRAAGLYLAGGGLVYKQSGGRISYFNTGGNNVADTIPAMLTPGEFVMSPEAVQKYGVGYMKSLNRGTVPGFRRGGLIGSGNVRYRSTGSNDSESGGGGSLSIDASGLQGVLTEFSANFQIDLDNMVIAFSDVGKSINNLASALSQGMTITHNFSGDMSLAFSIQNQDQLKNAVADAIQPKIEKIIGDEINRRLDEFQAGG